MRTLFLQTTTEMTLSLRRRETIVFSLLLPIMFLLFFGAVYGSSKLNGIPYISYIVPGYEVFSTMSVALGTITISLANERKYLILKRLGGTPLPRASLIVAKVIAASCLIAAVVVVLLLVGRFVYGAHIRGNMLEAIVVLLVGIPCFATMGIVLGGVIRPDSAVAISNIVYLALSFLGGIFVPLQDFSSGLRNFATLLPSERMVDALQTIWTRGDGLSQTGLDLPVVALWAAATLVVGARRFRWE